MSTSLPPVAQPPAARPPRPRVPPLWLWIAWLLAGAVIYLVQRPGFPDHQIGNIITLIVGFFALVGGLVWFGLFSGWGLPLRAATPFVFLALIAALAIPLRIEQVTGELVPILSYRFAPRHDERLERPTPAVTAPADLATTTADDFPQFLGPERRGEYAAVRLVADWQAGPPALLWRQEIGAGWSGFAVVNGYAVTLEQRGPSELITCYEAATGRLCWVHEETARHENLLGGIGPRSTPTIADGRVYALGATGLLNCLDGANGALVWRRDLRTEFGHTDRSDEALVMWGRAASPLVVAGKVIVPAGGPRGQEVSLVAYDAATGQEIWRGGNRQISYASPALATLGGVQQVVIVNEDHVTGHDLATGAELWSFPWPGNSAANASASQAVPLAGDRVLVSKGYGGGCAVWSISQSQGAWQVTEIWSKSDLLKTKFTNVAIRDGFAYGLSDGILECVDLAKGRRQWKRGRYGHGQVLLVGDQLLVQAEAGEVALVEANPERFAELAVLPALTGKTWNNPCLFGSLLLLRNDKEAACFRLPVVQ